MWSFARSRNNKHCIFYLYASEKLKEANKRITFNISQEFLQSSTIKHYT